MTLGIARTFQNLRLFKSLTVLENVVVPILVKEGYGPAGAIRRPATLMPKEVPGSAPWSFSAFSVLRKGGSTRGSLPYGEQRRLELSRALAASPKLLLIDEPGAGMNPKEVQGLLSDIQEIKETFGLTILIIEHQMGLVMRLSDSLVVMDFGGKIAEGTPEARSKRTRT